MEAWIGIIPFSNNLKRISTEKKRAIELRIQRTIFFLLQLWAHWFQKATFCPTGSYLGHEISKGVWLEIELMAEADVFSQDGYCLYTWIPEAYHTACSKFILIVYSHISWILEKAMTSHSSTLAWKIPWMEEPGRLQSMGSLRIGHDSVTSLSLFTFMHWRRKWQPTPVFLPGEFQGWRSPMGCHLWARTESDMTEAT